MKENRTAVKGCRVGLYARTCSTKETRHGSIDTQMSHVRRRIESDGYELERGLCFIDEGMSGSALLRPALKRLRAQAAAGAIDRLYVLGPDRLSRPLVDLSMLVEELQMCGVKLVFVNEVIGNHDAPLELPGARSRKPSHRCARKESTYE